MRLSEFAVRNVPFMLVASLLLGALGISAWLKISRTEDPHFPISAFSIVVVYPGADPQEIERQVIEPIEDAIHTLDDVKEIVPVTKEEGRRIEGDRAPRRERREGVDVLREIGGRVIIDLGGRPTVESSDRPRMERGAKETYYEELPRGRTRETIVRASATRRFSPPDSVAMSRLPAGQFKCDIAVSMRASTVQPSSVWMRCSSSSCRFESCGNDSNSAMRSSTCFAPALTLPRTSRVGSSVKSCER